MIKLEWLRYYETQDQLLRAYDAKGKNHWTNDGRECQRFVVIGIAGAIAPPIERRGHSEARPLLLRRRPLLLTPLRTHLARFRHPL